MKKLLFLIGAELIFMMLFSAIVCTAETVESGTCPENIEWHLDDAGILTVSGTGVMHYSEEQTQAPWSGLADSVYKVVIQEGITFIDSFAFMGFEKLEEIELPEGLTGIGNLAFADCKALKEIVIPDSVEGIGLYAFSGCTALEYVTFGNNILRAEFLFDAECPKMKAIYFNGTKEEWFTPVKIGFTSYRPIIGLPDVELIFLGDSGGKPAGELVCEVRREKEKYSVSVETMHLPAAKFFQVVLYDRAGKLIGVKTFEEEGVVTLDTVDAAEIKVHARDKNFALITDVVTKEIQ